MPVMIVSLYILILYHCMKLLFGDAFVRHKTAPKWVLTRDYS